MVFRAALGACAVAAALGAVGAGISRRDRALAAVAVIVAFVWGVVAGLFLLRALPSLPPVTALDRFLVILLPVALAIEVEAAANWLGGFWLTVERGGVALLAVPVLLHGSVWLEGASTPAAAILAAALFLWASWEGLSGEVRATDDRVVAVVTSLALVVAGLSIAMAGWLKGGFVALPLAGALVGSLLGAIVAARRATPGGGGIAFQPPGRPLSGLAGLTAAGLVSSFGMVVVGRCFGRLGSAPALLLLIAPLLAVVPAAIGRALTDAPGARLMRSATYRILLASVPLVIVLVGAKTDFDARMGRLLGGTRPSPPRQADSAGPEQQAVPAVEFGRDRVAGEVPPVEGDDLGKIGGQQAAEDDAPPRREAAAEGTGMGAEHGGDDIGEDEFVAGFGGKLSEPG